MKKLEDDERSRIALLRYEVWKALMFYGFVMSEMVLIFMMCARKSS